MELGPVFNKHKALISAGLAVLIVICAFSIYKAQDQIVEALKTEKEREVKKNEILADLGKQDKKIKSYKSLLGKKERSVIINDIGNIAKGANIKIVSMKPMSDQDYPVYMKYVFKLTAETVNYETLGKFISRLESAPDVYMVDEFHITPIFDNKFDNKREESGDIAKVFKGLSVEFRVGAYAYKD